LLIPAKEFYRLRSIFPDLENVPTIHRSSLGNFQLVDLEWRSAFTLEQNPRDATYLLCVAFLGYIEQRVGSVYCSSTTATLVNPSQSVTGITSEAGQALLIAIDRQSIEEVLAKLLNRFLKQPLVFAPAIDLTTDFGASLKEFVEFLGLRRDPKTASSPLMQNELERTLLTCLLKGVSNNYSEEILYHTRGAFACYVIKARSFIESHLQEDLHLTDIAAAAGVSPRLLQKAFAQHCGCSPMRFVTQTRLERIRAELEQASINTRIMDVMMCYGFTQSGKFAKEYQQLFGEKPSDTLKRSSQPDLQNSPLWQEIDDPHAERIVGGVVQRDFPEINYPETSLIAPVRGDPEWWWRLLTIDRDIVNQQLSQSETQPSELARRQTAVERVEMSQAGHARCHPLRCQIRSNYPARGSQSAFPPLSLACNIDLWKHSTST
jgi:AraC-like DNA-binding protein